MPRLGGGSAQRTRPCTENQRHQRRGVRSEGETLIVVWGALGLWLVLVVVVLAALRAAALADRGPERGARPSLAPEQEPRTRRGFARGSSHTAAVLLAVAVSPWVASQADAQTAG